MIKAGILTPNLSVGGAERWVATLLKYADPSRIKWTGLAVSGWGALDPFMCDEVIQTGVPIFAEKTIERTAPRGMPTPQVKSPDCEQYLIRTPNIATAVRRACHGADVLLTWGSLKYINFLNQPGVPNVFVYCSHSSHHPPAKLDTVRGVSSYLTAVSRRAIKPVSHPDNPPVTVIYNGVPEDRLVPTQSRAAMRSQWGFSNELLIGYVGRRSAEKNPIAAIQAAKQLGDGWGAVYYGSDFNLSAQPQLEFDAARVSPPSNVKFFESIPNVGDVYQAIDVLMLASHTEAFSLTMIEAWLSRVPVVSTPVGAVPELTEKFGKLVVEVPLKSSPRELAAACKFAVSEANKPVIERAYQIAKENFTAHTMALSWANYLHNVVSPSRLLELDL